MRKMLLAAAGAAAMTLCAFAGAANAMDTCHGPVSATGKKSHDEHRARENAYSAWQHKVAHKYGPKFADWWYSGERSVPCKWNAAGTVFTCTAIARPCARTN